MSSGTVISTVAQEAALRRPEVAKALCEELVGQGARRVILLGVPAVMGEPFLKAPLAKAGIMVLTPPQDCQSWIAEVMERELRQGEASDQTRASFESLVADGAEHGVDHLVVASVELMGLASTCTLGLPVVDALRAGASRIRHVVFDMGGVQFKFEPLEMARRVCSCEEDAQLLAQEVFGTHKWAQQDAGAIDDDTLAWVAKLRVPERLHESVDRLVYHWHDERTPVPQAGELIRELKDAGYGIYLLSDAGFSFDSYKHDLPAYDCFDGMVVSCYEGVAKPDARIYRTLCERYDLRPKDCLFVDDLEMNVIGGRRVGMQGWHFDGSVDALRYHILGRQ